MSQVKARIQSILTMYITIGILTDIDRYFTFYLYINIT